MDCGIVKKIIRPLLESLIEMVSLCFIFHKIINNKLKSCSRHENRENYMELKNGKNIFLRYSFIIFIFCCNNIFVFAQKKNIIENDVFFNDLVIPILDEGNMVTFSAKGESMKPTIRNGEKVCLQKQINYKIGDIVLAKVFDKKFVLHRIVQISRDSVFLKGDANQEYECCLVSDIVAKCISVEHHNESFILKRKIKDIDANTLFIKMPNFKIVKIDGKCFLYNTDISRVIELNETAEYLWINMDKYFKPKEMVNLILQKYDVDSSTAEYDVFELSNCSKLILQI